jgi:hypothetical protein
MKRPLTLLPALALAAVALVPATAGAMVQIDKGIAGARVNNTPAQVKAALGTPARIVRGTNDFGKFTQYRYAGGIVVTFQGRKNVTGVSTSGLGDRTAKGVGVGSTRAAVQAKVPGITCDPPSGGFRSCHTKTVTAGKLITDFLIKAGKVTRVTVGFVID